MREDQQRSCSWRTCRPVWSEGFSTRARLRKRIKLIPAKLDEGNIRAGMRLAASDDTVAPFDNNTYEKHPPRAANHAQQVVEDSLIVFEPTVAKAINSFPSGWSG